MLWSRKEEDSVLEIYSPVFSFGQTVGIFPQNLLFVEKDIKSSSRGDENTVKEHHLPYGVCFSGLKRLLRSFIFIFYVSHYIFTCVKWLSCILFDTGTSSEMKVAASGWILYGTLSFISISRFVSKVDSMKKILNLLRLVEEKILKANRDFNTKHMNLRSSLFYERKLFMVAVFYGIMSLVLIITFCIVNVIEVPRAFVYIYSLVPKDREILWIKYLSVVVQALFAFTGGLIWVHLQMLGFCVSRSLALCLRVISETPKKTEYSLKTISKSTEIFALSAFKTQTYHEHNHSKSTTMMKNNQNQDTPTTCPEFERAIEHYFAIRHTVQTYDKMFSNTLLFFKGLSLVLNSILLYATLRNRIETAQSALIIFHVASFLNLIRICTLLWSLGQIHYETKEFHRKWKKYLAWKNLLSHRNSALLHSCSPFGFMAGDFYVIRNSTVLTYFSILMSYIIFVLQL